ncbi:MAG: PKD domain-containing protein [Solirubrobacterales bacterium]|nr:PKD domain-containing protein [Solirubrobacterales bacterium]
MAGVALAEPKPDFSFSPESPTVGQTVTFTADDPCDPPVVCTWQFGDDGVAEPGRIVTHAYSAPGRVTATLTADDLDDGIDATPIPRTIDVLPVAVPNSPPVAAFSATPSAPSTGEIVQFDSSASSDPDGALIREWDLDGNGSFETGDLVKPFRSYADDGTVTVSLRVTDEDGASDAEIVPVRVVNQPPEVFIEPAEPSAPLSGQPVTFAATARDPDGAIKGYAWDVDGDGFDDGTGPTLTTNFARPGDEDVRVRVTDDDDATGQDVLHITIGNRSPTATVSASTTTPLTGDVVTFTSDASDPDGQVTYAWDLDGDGDLDDGTGPTAATTFAVPGRIVVRLRVTDDDAASVTVEQEVAVQASQVAQAPMTLLGPAGGLPVLLPAAPLTPVVLAAPRLLTPFPVVRFAGALSARGARLTLFTVRAPKGARIAASCRGPGCPPARAVRAAGLKRLPALQRAYRAGVRIEVRIMKPNRIGKYVRITIRKGAAPARKDACLWPGSRAPRACP